MEAASDERRLAAVRKQKIQAHTAHREDRLSEEVSTPRLRNIDAWGLMRVRIAVRGITVRQKIDDIQVPQGVGQVGESVGV